MEALFTDARTQLLAEQDQREQVIRGCRDITAAAKKLIFALHRSNSKQVTEHKQAIGTQLEALYKVYNSSKYKGNVSGAFEELSEGLLFEYYLTHHDLMTYGQFCDEVTKMASEQAASMFEFHNYFLGIYDLTGEVMRWCITAVAQGDVATAVTGWKFLQRLYNHMNDTMSVYPKLNFYNGVSGEFHHKGSGSVSKKMEVFGQSLNKVQTTLCEYYVRGDEFAKDNGGDESGSLKRPLTEENETGPRKKLAT
ncbi:hypothetical protein DIRU0_D11958 [Diutina rugosa]